MTLCPARGKPDESCVRRGGRDVDGEMSTESWAVERRSDGAVLVRVPSDRTQGAPLPDAVFAFRAGDPQFTYWDEQLRQREHTGCP